MVALFFQKIDEPKKLFETFLSFEAYYWHEHA